MIPWARAVFLPAALVAASLLLLTSAAAPADKALATRVQQALKKKYPGQQIAEWCGGSFLGRPQDAAVALHDPAEKQFRVLWIDRDGKIRELQSLDAFGAPPELDLKCLDRKQAKQLKETLQHSEAVRDFLHVPPGKGALCYFIEPTQTRCWSVNDNGDLIDAGGWQT